MRTCVAAVTWAILERRSRTKASETSSVSYHYVCFKPTREPAIRNRVLDLSSLTANQLIKRTIKDTAQYFWKPIIIS